MQTSLDDEDSLIQELAQIERVMYKLNDLLQVLEDTPHTDDFSMVIIAFNKATTMQDIQNLQKRKEFISSMLDIHKNNRHLAVL